MLERQEIDALIISALYGELSPTEESRLAAHFEAHPADKTALAALTSTREAVRESRILQVQLEPPQSVSALLMQEAARRAPKAEEREGWFARLARSFMAHPAMAAAAMLVVVLGVATLVRNRKGDEIVESQAPATAENTRTDSASGGPAQAAPEDRERKFEDSVAAQGHAGSGAGSDSYAVGLADENEKNAEAVAKQTRKEDRPVDQQIADAKVRAQVAKTEAGAYRDGTATGVKGKDSGVASDLAKKPATKAPSGAMELRRPDPTPKELDGDGVADDYTTTITKDQVNAITPGASGRGGGGSAPNTGAGSGYAVPPPATGSTAPVTQKVPTADPNGAAPTKPTDTRVTTTTPTAPPSRQSPPPVRNQGPSNAQPSPPPPPKVADSPPRDAPAQKKAAAPAEDKSANDPQLAWAREQHTAIVARVRAGDCKGAGNLAVTLANRAPAYYQQNVATDRSVKECLAYINEARDRDASERAERTRASQKQQRANEPAKRAADQPAKATAVDAAH